MEGALDPETWADARGCLRGRPLREEAFAMGEGGPAAVTLSVSQSGYTVRIEQRPQPRDPGIDRRPARDRAVFACRSEEHTSELQSLMRISYAVFCLKKKQKQ